MSSMKLFFTSKFPVKNLLKFIGVILPVLTNNCLFQWEMINKSISFLSKPK